MTVTVMVRLRAVLKLTLVVLLVVAVLVTLAWLGQRRLIYLPDRGDPPPAAEVVPGGREVRLTTSDGLELGAWLVPPGSGTEGATGRDRAQLVVLVAPGNAGNRAGRAPLADALADAGLAVLLLDYRGYGGNPGRPTEAGLARDVRAAYHHLVDEVGVPPRRIIYFGESLGAGVVTELATEHPPGGLVLRSPFTDLSAVAAHHYPFLPVRAMLWDRYPVAEQIGQVRVPTAVVYGSRDSVVPPAHSREVAERAAGPVQVTEIAGADHNDPELLAGARLVAAVTALADRIEPR